MIESVIHQRLSDASVSSLITGIYPSEPPVNPDALPFLVYTVTGGDQLQLNDGPSGLVAYNFNVEVWSRKFAELNDITGNVKALLNGWSGASVQLCSWQGSASDRQDDVYHSASTFGLWVSEDVNLVAAPNNTAVITTGENFLTLAACENVVRLDCDGLTLNGEAVAFGEGAQGPPGQDGLAATITVGTTTTGNAGTNASVTNVGTANAATLNFTIPRGNPGTNGTNGNDGQAATVTVGTTTTGNAGTNASVTNGGTSSAAVLNFTVPRGANGSNGTNGADGQAATITVGTTTTGNAGTNASVTNSGTSSAATLNFTIPRGANGSNGTNGNDGAPGPNSVTTGTASNLTGYLKGKGSNVSAVTTIPNTDVTGLGTSSTHATSDFLQTANNLSDLGSGSSARTNLGLGTLATQSGTFSGTHSGTSSGTNTGDQTITLTGDVTGSGTGSFAATIGAGKVTNSMLAGSIAASKLVGSDIATVGTITAGTWNGTTIAVANGGTGQTSASTAINALVPTQTSNSGKYLTTNGTAVSWATVSGGSGTTLVRTADGRLSASSGVSVPTSDVSSTTSLYYVEHTGNQIALYDGSTWNVRTFSNYTMPLGTLTASRPYDVFLYDNSGSVSHQFVAWTDGTTRATTLTTQDGVQVKNGDATKRYVGTFYTTSTTATADTMAKRFVWNANNRVPLQTLSDLGYTYWTYSGASWREVQGVTTYRRELVCGSSGQSQVGLSWGVFSGASNYRTGWGEDSSTPGLIGSGAVRGGVNLYQVSSAYVVTIASLLKRPNQGYHYYTPVEYSSAGTADNYTNNTNNTGVWGAWEC